MTSFVQNITRGVSNAVLFMIGLVIAAMGLALVGIMSIFALGIAGLAILAAPFVGGALAKDEDSAVDAEPQHAV